MALSSEGTHATISNMHIVKDCQIRNSMGHIFLDFDLSLLTSPIVSKFLLESLHKQIIKISQFGQCMRFDDP